ncbi:hypothetical protein GGF31_002553 [Allomyces arbusculus]|nr:hypothetical protein GGF31_002553 [Allomyces arbusculus]
MTISNRASLAKPAYPSNSYHTQAAQASHTGRANSSRADHIQLSTTGQGAYEQAVAAMTASLWEGHLLALPMTVGLLGEVQLLATKRDFSLRASMPAGGFEHIKWPDSFRASLVQIVSMGWESFNLAHTKMTRIKLASCTVPDTVNELYEVLVHGDEDEVAEYAPEKLEVLAKVAAKCKKDAEDVTDKFGKVLNLVSELHQACFNQQSITEREKRQDLASIEVAKKRQAMVEADMEDKAARVGMLRGVLDQERDHLKGIREDIPTSWNGLCKGIVGLTTSVMADAFTRFAKTVTFSGDTSSDLAEQLAKLGHLKSDLGRDLVSNAQAPASISSGLSNDLIMVLEHLLKLAMTIDCGGEDMTTPLATIREQLTSIESRLSLLPGSTLVLHDFKAIVEQALTLQAKIDTVSHSSQAESAVFVEIRTAASHLVSQCYQAISTADQARVAAAELKKTSRVATTLKAANQTMDSVFNKEYAVWQDRMQEVKEQIQDLHQEVTKESTELDALKLENKELMERLSKLDLSTTSFGEVLEYLAEGIKALERIHVQWANLCRFFDDVASTVEHAGTSVEKLTGQASRAMNLRLTKPDKTLSKLSEKQLYALCLQAETSMTIVDAMAQNYVDVSTNYVLQPLAELGKISTLNPQSDALRIQELQQKLLTDAIQSQNDIATALEDNKGAFIKGLHAKIAASEFRRLKDLQGDE